ncbi:unnamed protein product [Brassica napus]|uniref:Glutamate receptor n=3 Tax=Brassica TaxID=3705 RepID=A0A816K510_BRANA|nr:unnamed protein product [Brassica napus]
MDAGLGQNTTSDEIKVGVVIDLKTNFSKICLTSINMSLSDFYQTHPHYRTRLALHVRDSMEDIVEASAAAYNLINNEKVRAIIGPRSSMQAEFMIKLATKSQVPTITFSATSPLLRTINNPYFVRATIDDSFQAEAIASIVKSFGWRSVVAIYVDNELGQGIMPSLSEALEDVEVHRSVISPEASDDHILKELYKLKTEQTRVFVINMDASLGFQVLKKAREIGMMEEGYVWLLSNGMTHMMRHNGRSLETMQGLLGVRSHVPRSKEREDFSLRWKRKFQKENRAGDGTEPNVFALWAYDSKNQTNTFSFRSLVGKHLCHLDNMDMIASHVVESSTFEIINVIGDEERIIGLWTPSSGLVNAKSNKTTSFLGKRFGPVIWPGNSTVVPKGWEIPTSGKKIKVGVPVNKGFLNFVEIKTNPISNLTTVRGYAIDIFEAALKELPYSVIPQYGFEPPGDNYNDLVYQVFDGKWDAVVGDITITSNRSSYVDFTLPYTESGVSMIVPVRSNKNKNSWVFLKPWSLDLWITTGCFFVFIGFVVWLFEHRVNTDFRGPPHHQIGTSVCFSFSTMVFAHREKVVSNLARFVVVVWCFVVLVLTQSYTASLTSFLTVQSLLPTATNVEDLIRSGESVGYQQGGFVKDILLGLKFFESQLKPFGSAEECDDLLSKGTSKGGIAAAFDDVPYLKDIVSENCFKYAMVEPSFKTAGFKPSFKTIINSGFLAFPKNSPMTGDVSRAILKVIMTQSKEMSLIENKWFNRLSLASDCPGPDTADLSSNHLTLSSFWGLFLIAGVASFLALLIFVALFLYEHRHTLCRESEGSIWRKLNSLFIIFDAKDIKSHTFKSSAVHNVSSPITPCTASPSNVQIRPLQRSMSLSREF